MVIVEEYQEKETQTFRFIFLVIASKSDIYDRFLCCWKEYMQNSVQEWNIKCFFVFSDPSISCDLLITKDTIVYKQEETLMPGIFLKTMAALYYCEKKYSYDYILRTNLSSFFHIPKLLSFFVDKNKKDTIYSPIQVISKNKQIYWENFELYFSKELIHENIDFIPFLDGACFILTHDFVSILLQYITNSTQVIIPWYKHLNNTDVDITVIPDDILITMILQRILSYTTWVYFKIIYGNDLHLFTFQKENDFFIRNRTDHIYGNRETDVVNYINQVRFFYSRPFFIC